MFELSIISSVGKHCLWRKIITDRSQLSFLEIQVSGIVYVSSLNLASFTQPTVSEIYPHSRHGGQDSKLLLVIQSNSNLDAVVKVFSRCN